MSEWTDTFHSNIRHYMEVINNYLLQNNWELVEVGSVLEKNSEQIKDAILAKNYNKEGKFPIVSQSKDLISGYTNDESLLNIISKPIVIFGDHTQVVKYIDFPFIIGADGVKILKPNEHYRENFFYYLIKSIDLKSKKYARHYSKLRKAKIPFKKDSHSFQDNILSFLSDFENNTLTKRVYFDERVEHIIKSLQKNHLIIYDLLNNFSSQSNCFSLLRQSILQEAIEGKLTAEWRAELHGYTTKEVHGLKIQTHGSRIETHGRASLPALSFKQGDPEYDARALLEKIKEEKERLIAEGKGRRGVRINVRDARPCVSTAPIKPEEAPFELPEGWVWTRLGEVTELISGQHIEATDCNSKGIGMPYLTGPADFGEKYPFITKWTKEPKVLAKKNDLLITVKGSGVGKTNICNLESVVISRQLMAIRSNIVNRDFVRLFVLSMKQFLQETKDGLIPGITRDHILDSIFPLPPLTEQRAIVERVDRLIAMVDELEKQVVERKLRAEDLMQAVLREAFGGR